MEYDKKSKKGKRKVNKENTDSDSTENIEMITREKLKNYFDIEISEISKENLQKFSYYIEKYELAIKLKESKNYVDLFELGSSNQKKFEVIQIENYHLTKQHEQLESEKSKIKSKSSELHKKFTDKEKMSKLLIEKIKTINEEKNKIIQEETERRNVIVHETEKFVKDIQEKYEIEIPEKQKAIDENQKFRKEIESCVQTTLAAKEEIENKLKEKDREALNLEDNYKKDIRKKMEETTLKAQKYLFENSELKTQIISIMSKNIEMEKAEETFKTEFSKLENELEKKKQDVVLLSKENLDLRKKVKKTYTKEALEQILKDSDKVKNQLNLMKNLNKKLSEQHKKLTEEKTQNTINDI